MFFNKYDSNEATINRACRFMLEQGIDADEILDYISEATAINVDDKATVFTFTVETLNEYGLGFEANDK